MDKLVVSAKSMSAFSNDLERQFEDKLVVHLRKLFAEKFRELSEVLVRRVVRLGMSRAEQYGFVREDHVCSYVDMMFVFGHEFDVVSGWARPILLDGEITAIEKAKRLYASAVDNLRSAAGICRWEVEAMEVWRC